MSKRKNQKIAEVVLTKASRGTSVESISTFVKVSVEDLHDIYEEELAMGKAIDEDTMNIAYAEALQKGDTKVLIQKYKLEQQKLKTSSEYQYVKIETITIKPLIVEVEECPE